MNLKRRLRALERVVVHRDDHRCEACGYGTGAEIEFVVAFADEEIDGPDFCPTCGRVLVISLTFDDALDVGGRFGPVPAARTASSAHVVSTVQELADEQGV